MAGEVIVDQLAGDAEPGRDERQVVEAEPAGVLDLGGVDPHLAAGVPGHEADHQRVGEGPRLAAEVAYVADLDPDLLPDLPRHGLFERLPGLDEAGDGAVDPGHEVGRAGEE